MMTKIKKSQLRNRGKDAVKRVGHITIDILELLYRFTECYFGAFERKSLYKKLNQMNYSDTQIFNNLRNLIDAEYIEPVTINNQKSIKLTGKGKLKLLENSKDNKCDGKWRLLSFDIPEDSRIKRNQLRRTIKRIGFRQVQKSLWACPFSRADLIESAINELGLSRYVAYFIVEKTDIFNYLEKLFCDVLDEAYFDRSDK